MSKKTFVLVSYVGTPREYDATLEPDDMPDEKRKLVTEMYDEKIDFSQKPKLMPKGNELYLTCVKLCKEQHSKNHGRYAQICRVLTISKL